MHLSLEARLTPHVADLLRVRVNATVRQPKSKFVWLAQFNTPELWDIYFTRFWRLAFAGLAIFIFTKRRIWVSLGLVTAVLLQALEI